MLSSQPPFERVLWIVLDGVGAGELPDAASYGDQGSDTLGNLSRAFHKKTGRHLKLPTLESWGLGSLTPMQGVTTPWNHPLSIGRSAIGRAQEQSAGKDTTSGHWEMAGLVVQKPFKTYPKGFAPEIVDRWIKENQLPGVLGNCAASGTEIIERLGAEHLKTKKPILYTSADSVWQVAAHEEAFGLERLYAICKSARKICDELGISRVIARPFVGDPSQGVPFKRTYHRKDYAQSPGHETWLNVFQKEQIPTLGIGKIASIFAGEGIDHNIDTEGNTDGLRVTLEQLQKQKKGLIYCNLIDFDMLYGHRRNVEGFGLALEEFDQALATLTQRLGPKDLVVITSDHGNDPTYKGTDHTREYVPIITYSPTYQTQPPVQLGDRTSFGDIGATVAEALLGTNSYQRHAKKFAGQSFLSELN